MDDQDGNAAAEDHPLFAIIAKRMVRFTGSGWAIATTLVVIGLWVAAGAALHFSRAWELSTACPSSRCCC